VDLISSLSPSQAPQTRSQTKAKARAETLLHEDTRPDLFQSTPLNTLFTNDLDDEQIWAQVDLRTQTICQLLDHVLEGDVASSDLLSREDSAEDDEDADERLKKVLEALEQSEDIDIDEFLAQYGLDDSDSDDSQDDDDLEESTSESHPEEEEMQEDFSPLRDPSSSEEESECHHPLVRTSRKRKRGEPSELDDGFFDLAEFNAHTERAEAMSSSRGRLAGGDSDDDEEIDLFTSVDSNADLGDDGKDGGGMYYRCHRIVKLLKFSY
jgi:U3 small nucleolar RNA-associated protein MPP10